MRILRNIIDPHSTELTAQGVKNFNYHIWPFLLDPEWVFVDKLEDADIVPFMGDCNYTAHETMFNKLRSNQKALVLNIFHIDDMMDYNYFQRFRNNNPNVIVVHKNKAIEDQPGYIYYDCMFNRHKLYFTEYHKIENLPDLVWTMGSTKDTYRVPDLNKMAPKNCKLFLSPNLVYHYMFVPRMRYRQALKDYVNLKYSPKCIGNTKENFFPSNNPAPIILERLKEGAGGFWYPIADEYYRQTYISLYVETITVNFYNTRCITEKTFDPLIKGNFILPFAYSGFFQDVLDYGFVLPSFIDYSYDSFKDNDYRFSCYLSSIDKICELSDTDMRDLYEQNKWMAEFNKAVFFERPYDRLYPKVAKQFG